MLLNGVTISGGSVNITAPITVPTVDYLVVGVGVALPAAVPAAI